MSDRASDIRDSIIFLGKRNDVERLYQAMDVFVLPSRYEGLPVVGVEAQSAGLPCVFSDVITREAILAEDTRTLDISLPAASWGDALLSVDVSDNRPKKRADLDGFDIKKECKRLEQFYCEKNGQSRTK